MFLDSYNLREQPFGVTPDPRYLYFSPGHREALASLFYGIETGRGFLSLIAEPGMGKTTLLFQLLKRWKGYVHSAFLFQTQCDSRELLRYLLEDLGLDCHNHDIVRMHSELNDFLYRESKAGKQVVVFIDESQNLSDTVLETVRLLSDFEASDKKLLQIVLAGQPELANRLSHPGLAQLRQRISIQARLDPLPAGEVTRYIDHRLQVAGYRGPGLFTSSALSLIAQRSRGIPRIINNICFNALSLGCANHSDKIDYDIVRECALDLSLEPKPQLPQASHYQSTTSPAPPLKTQVAPSLYTKLVPSLRIKSEAFFSWMKKNLLGQRLPQTSAVLILLTALVAYVGVRSGARTAQPSASNHVETASAATIQRKAPPDRSKDALDVRPVHDVSTPEESNTSLQATGGGNSIPSFVYVVQPNDTLHDLCVSTIGRYDHEVIAEIQRLNPDLKNLNHLEVGQEIRFPLSSTK